MMSTSRLGRAVQRFSLLAFGFALSLIVLELVMQLGAVGVRLAGRKARGEWLTGESRVLSLGDSFTYGLFVERSEAYPAVFESLWNRSSAAHRVEVMNLGFPGANSFQTRNEFPRLMRTFAPDVVTIMVGANDYWTVRPAPRDPSAWDRVADTLFKHSRVVRLAFMLRRAVEKTRLEVVSDVDGLAPQSQPQPVESGRGGGVARFGDQTFDLSWRRAERGAKKGPTSFEADLEANLVHMASEAKARGAEVVFLSYPTGVAIYARASAALRRAAAATGATFVDVTPLFAPLCPHWSCPVLFPDQHPTAEGHRMVAQALFDQLRSEER